MFTSGGAVMVQLVAEQEAAGKIVLCPILFPYVELVAPIRLTFEPVAFPVGRMIEISILSP